MTLRRRLRLRFMNLRLANVRAGFYWGYPACCILRFILSPCGAASRRGFCTTPEPSHVSPPTGRRNNFVPCGVFHKDRSQT